jgi:hypothetical protein
MKQNSTFTGAAIAAAGDKLVKNMKQHLMEEAAEKLEEVAEKLKKNFVSEQHIMMAFSEHIQMKCVRQENVML